MKSGVAFTTLCLLFAALAVADARELLATKEPKLRVVGDQFFLEDVTIRDSVKAKVVRVSAGHQRTSYRVVNSYNNWILNTTDGNTTAYTCNWWQPYIDLASGHLMAKAISKTRWAYNSTGGIVKTPLNCEIKGDELPGCYVEGANGAVRAASASDVGLPMNRSASVIAVSQQTYECLNGECMAFAPKYYKLQDREH